MIETFSDKIEAVVDIQYSNIAELWVASLDAKGGGELLSTTAPTRAKALRRLANLIDGGE